MKPIAAYKEERRARLAVFRSIAATSAMRVATDELDALLLSPMRGHEQAIDILGTHAASIGTQAVWPAMKDSLFQRADVASIEQHLLDGCSVEHPQAGWGYRDGADRSLCAAVEGIQAWGKDSAAKRDAVMAKLGGIFDRLEESSKIIRERCSPAHIREQRAGPDVHVAAIECLCRAMQVDPHMGGDFACGFMNVDDVLASGWFEPCSPPAEAACVKELKPACLRPDRLRHADGEEAARCRLDELDHAAWVRRLARDVEDAGRAAEAAQGDSWSDVLSVFSATEAEIRDGLMEGFFTATQLDAKFGAGRWRPMRRFGVWQKGKCRPCDNAKESWHNLCTYVHEKLRLCSGDFPARVAALFAASGAGAECSLQGGTDDIASAYRRLWAAMPAFSVVALYHPGRRATVFATMPGFNFGEVSAVLQFNRYSAFVSRAMRQLFHWCGAPYFDDFCTVEPAYAKGSGQKALAWFMARLGIPTAPKKHVPMAARFVFLGVESDLAAFAQSQCVLVGVTRERCDRLASAVEAVLDSGVCFDGESSSLSGRLGFASQWSHGRFGRALMGPLYAHDASAAPTISTALRGALRVWLEILLVGLPRRRVYLQQARRRPTVKVWTDAAWEPSERNPAYVAFVVFFPAERGQQERWVYGHAPVPAEVMDRFVARKQYIGQLELLAAVAVYWSVPELRGRDVIHWIDNQGAIAALVKGYSRAPDSVQILHAFVVFTMALGLAIWFEYVPSAANIADLPSRLDFVLLQSMGAVEVPFIFPPFPAWDAPASVWLKAAQETARPPPMARGAITVANHRHASPREGDIAVDRAHDSALRNVFTMRSETERAAVCEAFRELCESGDGADAAEVAARRGLAPVRDGGCQAARLAQIEAVAQRMATGLDTRLVCWCAPRRCHADDIALMAVARADEILKLRRGKRRR